MNDKLLEELSIILEKAGWQLAIPTTEDGEEVRGLIIGTPEFLDEVENQMAFEEVEGDGLLH